MKGRPPAMPAHGSPQPLNVDKLVSPVAIREAMAFTEAQFGTTAVPPVDYDLIPTAVFWQPNIGTVVYSMQRNH